MIISDENTYIKIYHNISEIFYTEYINIIEFPKENINKSLVINIRNIKSIIKFEYLIFYGYKNLIPANLIKIKYSNQYLYINNEYEKMENLNENIKLYIYIFGNETVFNISYIKTYKLNSSSFYSKIIPKDGYFFISEKNYLNSYYSSSYVEIYLCRNDINKNPMNITITDANGKIVNNILNKNYN